MPVQRRRNAGRTPWDLDEFLHREQKHKCEAWLNSSRNWRSLDPIWKPVKVLGNGGFGIVGLWRNTKTKKRIVIKQAAAQRWDGSVASGLEEEASMLKLLRGAGSSHILKMYGDIMHGEGRNFVYRMDCPGPVERIFLEYCPGGDLLDWVTRRKEEKYLLCQMQYVTNCLL